MLSRDVRLFWGSFFFTLILCGWFAAFLIVDGKGARYEPAAAVPALEVSREHALQLNTALLGQRYTLDLSPLNQLEELRKQYACLVTPRGLLTLEKGYSLVVYGKKHFYEKYKEEQYILNVAKSQGEIPVLVEEGDVPRAAPQPADAG